MRSRSTVTLMRRSWNLETLDHSAYRPDARLHDRRPSASTAGTPGRVGDPEPVVGHPCEGSDAQSLLAGERVEHAYAPTTRNVRNLVRNTWLAWKVVAKERPRVVITTGAGVAVPFAWIARLRGARIVYVESLTRIDRLSLSARLVAPSRSTGSMCSGPNSITSIRVPSTAAPLSRVNDFRHRRHKHVQLRAAASRRRRARSRRRSRRAVRRVSVRSPRRRLLKRSCRIRLLSNRWYKHAS